MTDTIGHNTSVALLRFVERVERLEEEKSVLADDIKEVYGEAKGEGFDAPTMRRLIRLRKMDPEARAEQEALLETYEAALDEAELNHGEKPTLRVGLRLNQPPTEEPAE